MSIEDDLKALQDQVNQWGAEAARRFTAVETGFAEGSERMGQIEANVQPVLDRLAALEKMGAQIQASVTTIFSDLAHMAGELMALDLKVQALTRVARPGRSAVREAVSKLEDEVAKLKEAKDNGDTEDIDEDGAGQARLPG